MHSDFYQSNQMFGYGKPLSIQDAEAFGEAATDRVLQVLKSEGIYTPTPLHSMPALANKLGLGSLILKDESFRFGLRSFKALGGAYALMTLVREEASRRLGRSVNELKPDEIRSTARTMTFACATDGNHGRSVAYGARLMGSRAVIFVHPGVSASRVEAISSLGAEIVRTQGTYDDSVLEATRVSKAENWIVLSDTSWPGYEHIPSLVMQGYTVLVREVLSVSPKPPTHVFLQAGVGGLAAAVAGHMALVLGSGRPHVTVVEPIHAACLYESAKVGYPVRVPALQRSVMAMLECYEPSLAAFRILERVCDGFMTIDDESATTVMRLLADPFPGDPPVVAGESGGAGLAGAVAALRDRAVAAQIGLGSSSRVLVINTEGATDPVLYKNIVGHDADAVLKGRDA